MHGNILNSIAAFYSEEGWSNDFVSAMDGQEDYAELNAYLAKNETKEWTSVYVVRHINGKETPRALLYVGLTSATVEHRFAAHRRNGTFAKHDRVERAILKEGLTKGAAEFLEATLILSSRPTFQLLNTNTEYRHLSNNIEDGPQFAAEVRHWHKLAVHMLCAQWNKLDWEEWRPLLDENEKEGTRKRGERSRSPSKAELKKELAEKDAALLNSHEFGKKWNTRAWNERKRAEQFSEAVSELDHSIWTELTKDDDERSDESFDENMDENSDDDDTLVFNG